MDLGRSEALVQPAPVCLYALSKDLCGTRLFGGTWDIPTCANGGTNCFNLVGEAATFRGGLASSLGTCGPDAESQLPCDEAPDFAGTLDATVDVRAQRHTHCKGRGSFGGKFKITDSETGGTLASGDLVATLGMGTHRSTCSGACGTGECETCHDARILDEQFNWEIGSEGTLRGTVVAGPYAGCQLTASFQGNFITDGDSRGPTAPFVTWGFCGALEGVLECPCGIPAPES
jgi:hypothetical protein